MAREAGCKQELERWPEFRKLYLRTFQRILDVRRQIGMTVLDSGETAVVMLCKHRYKLLPKPWVNKPNPNCNAFGIGQNKIFIN